MRLDRPVNPTDIAKVTVVGCPGAVLRDLTVRHYEAPAGSDEYEGSGPGGGHGATGVLVQDSPGARVENVSVRDVQAGHGGRRRGCSCNRHEGHGGWAYGMRVVGSSEAVLSGIHVRDVRPGPGGLFSTSGDVVGLTVTGDEVSIDDVVVERLETSRERVVPEHPGSILGVDVGGEGVTIRHVFVRDFAGRRVGGVRLAGANIQLSAYTAHDLRGEAGGGWGLYVQPDAERVRVHHALFASLSHDALVNDPDNEPRDVLLAWSRTHAVAGAPTRNASVDEASVDVCDPQFDFDFGLDPASTCVDAGDPDLPCEDEPSWEDTDHCVLDVGHLSGTDLARAAAPRE